MIMNDDINFFEPTDLNGKVVTLMVTEDEKGTLIAGIDESGNVYVLSFEPTQEFIEFMEALEMSEEEEESVGNFLDRLLN